METGRKSSKIYLCPWSQQEQTLTATIITAVVFLSSSARLVWRDFGLRFLPNVVMTQIRSSITLNSIISITFIARRTLAMEPLQLPLLISDQRDCRSRNTASSESHCGAFCGHKILKITILTREKSSKRRLWIILTQLVGIPIVRWKMCIVRNTGQ